jgi:hypothetical protein
MDWDFFCGGGCSGQDWLRYDAFPYAHWGVED